MAFRKGKVRQQRREMGLFLNQFPKKILRPYGAVEQAPSEETVLKRVKPNSCEWLKRPKVAMSEMAETLTANMDMLATKESPLLSKNGVKSYKAKLAPLMKNLNMHVMITQNRDKANGLVNGQTATILCVEKATVFLALGNGKALSSNY